MKVNQMDTTKEAVKTRLDKIATLANCEWHSQFAHKMAVCSFFLDMLEVKDQAIREQAAKQWLATPNAFGANASAMALALGRESNKVKTDKAFAGI